MDVLSCVRSRRTVRSFRSDTVPDSIIDKILDAARWTPSSRNQQPWHLIVVKNRQTLTEISRIAASGRFISDAPLAIAIAMENADRPELDAGRALQQMELVAWAEGLGTCFVGLRLADQNQEVKRLLGIPEELELITVLPFGYRPDDFEGRGVPRKPMPEIAHSERFSRAYRGGS